jgi:hypothetical protein
MLRDKKFRRKLLRFKCSKEVKYSYISSKTHKIDIINISEDGAMLRVLQVFREGDIIDLYFDSGPVIVSEIKYSINHIIGVKFINLDESLLKFLKTFIKEFSK